MSEQTDRDEGDVPSDEDLVREYAHAIMAAGHLPGTIPTAMLWARACVEVEKQHTAAKCTCYPFGFTPDTYEGPQEDCPEHGRPYAEWVERATEAEAEVERQAALLDAINDCHRDPARAILQADKIAGAAILRAERAEATIARVEALKPPEVIGAWLVHYRDIDAALRGPEPTEDAQ